MRSKDIKEKAAKYVERASHTPYNEYCQREAIAGLLSLNVELLLDIRDAGKQKYMPLMPCSHGVFGANCRECQKFREKLEEIIQKYFEDDAVTKK